MENHAFLLLLILTIPIVATLGIFLFRNTPNLREFVSLVAGFSVFSLSWTLFQKVRLNELVEWHLLDIIPGLSIHFKIDELGAIFALVAGFLWIITTLYSIGYMRGHHEKNQTRFYICFAIAISAVLGVAYSENLFTLFVFYEVLTLSTYPLVTHAGTEKAKGGGRTYLGILIGTSIVFLLPAIIITWLNAGTVSFTAGGVFSEGTSTTLLTILLILFIFGIGKAAIMPIHRWLPAAMLAPTPVSALLHAVAVVKAGVFSVLKVCVFIFGAETLSSLDITQLFIYLAGATILISSLIAMRQDNLKKRLAYSTISQLSYVILGALLVSSLSVTGSALHIVMHAFGKITLFFCAGAILVASHKSNISEMRGLGRQMPVTMIAFFIASLSIIGLPPVGGTWSKWFLIMSTIEAEQLFLMSVLMISSLLNIYYLLPIPIKAFMTQENTTEQNKGTPFFAIKEAPIASVIAIVITTLCCLLLFIFPQSFVDMAQRII
ncbi:MAG: monovalent cation/H+ antiporter subunit D family protein [Gammaproteobacteria bacterium]|nr:monovalent cation/H+ antiporter subunit D family protein [Gammaproteobacteria bacterium]